MDNLSKFHDICFSLEQDAIIKLKNVTKSGDLNAVISGLEKHCYGVYVVDDSKDLQYEMFYISNNTELSGFTINLSSEEPECDELTFVFANYLTQEYPELDLLDTFNTLQTKVRKMYEMYDIITRPVTGKEEEGSVTYFLKGHRGIKSILMIDKLDFYRDFFQSEVYGENNAKEKCVYLMLNVRNGQIKIGQSIDPKFREKTLMGQEPSIHVISAWIAPISVEKELHRKFESKNIRGEWFNLTFKDCEIIKSYMMNYAQLECY